MNELKRFKLGQAVYFCHCYGEGYGDKPYRCGTVRVGFITNEEFLNKEKDGFFAETTSYNVATGETWYYGSAINDLSDDKVMIVNPEGLRKIKQLKFLNPISFLIMADEETIWNRLRQRGDNAAEARRRLNADDADFADIMADVDFSLKNDLGIAPKVMAGIIHYIYTKFKEK